MPDLRRLWVLTLLLSLVCGGCGRAPRAHYERAGGYSYDPPAGWTARSIPGMKYQADIGPPANGFAPNINVVDETYPGSLAAYADLNVTNIKRLFTGAAVVRHDNFTTLDGKPAARVVVEDEQLNRRLRQTFYFFENGSRKYVATCSATALDGESLDGTFEASMKTFRTH